MASEPRTPLDTALRQFPVLLTIARNLGVESDAVALCINRRWFEILHEYRRARR